jgi:WD40 repeat protein
VPPIPIGHGEISQLAWSRDGTALVSANGDHTLSVVDLTTPAHPVVLAPIGVPGQGTLRAVVVNPQRDQLAAAGDDGRIALYRWGPDHVPTPLDAVVAHGGPIQSLAFSPDGDKLASGSADKTAKEWSVVGGRLASLGVPLAGHSQTIWSMVWDGPSELITGSQDGTARMWNVADPRQPSVVSVLPTGTSGVLALTLAPDGRTLAGGGADGSTLLWTLPATILTDDISRVYAIALSPNRQWLATGVGADTVRLWDVHDPSEPVKIPGEVAGTSFKKDVLAFSGDGHTLATQILGLPVHIWNISPAGQVTLLSSLPQATEYSQAIAISPDGGYLITEYTDNTLALYDLHDPRHPIPLASPPTRQSGYVIASGFSDDGKLLFTAASDGSCQLWDAHDPRHLSPLGAPIKQAQINTAALRPDGRVLAVASNDRQVRLWDLTNPLQPRSQPPLTGFAAPPTTLAWSPDGTTLATGGADKTVRVWSGVSSPTPTYQVLSGQRGTINGLLWHGPSTVISSSEDQSVMIWNLSLQHQQARICATTSAITEAQWRQEALQGPYNPPCPTAEPG